MTEVYHRIRRKLSQFLNDNGESSFGMEKFAIDSKLAKSPREFASTSLDSYFYGHKGRTVHKWTHYLEFYDRHLAKYQNTDFKMLEIGVSLGGSLDLWRQYFGPTATIFGVDINPECINRVTPPNQVRIGSQADKHFLEKVVAEMGNPDVILDDGSHVASHQLESFKILFPYLQDGGIYIIEDMHTSYVPGEFEGGYRRKGTAIEFVKNLIDDMHGWYHFESERTGAKLGVLGVHVYDSMVFIEKGKKSPPRHVMIN